jgi:hypothetical protein
MSRVSVALAILVALWVTDLPATQEPVVARTAWQGLAAIVDALADRFGPVVREPGFDALRPTLARSALVPSPLFDDSTAWLTRGDTWRAFELAGLMSGGAYRMGLRAQAPQPAVGGQYRGSTRLERLAGGRFEWTVSEDLSTGEGRPADIARAFEVMFRQAERSTDASARAAIAAALPRASSQFGHLLRLDGLTLRRDTRGATSVRLVARLTPAGLRRIAPRYAEFLDKQARPIRLSLALADPGGTTWWTVDAADAVWTVRLRVRDGALVPLDGPADRRLPPRLRATADVATRLGRFGVGARGITADVSLTRTPVEHGFSLRFLQEPDWQLPFLVETVLDSPLHFPFEAPGSEIAWAARESAAGGALTRRYRARVRESWILRWLGSMANDAVGDFRNGAEREADRYHRACLVALRDDLAALDAAP